ncbi:hypothetical protein [Embleya hyalina]|uniref:Uncharacterized protein n=1 Tax=Embleya hyalina TaxID=516124 RepID=A0A401YQR5_9ACTN|nr:hypothetical protein [Embleya hyalina]GCD96907.1 hypothetical protein EHYA_04594 [Embleya hyalina]
METPAYHPFPSGEHRIDPFDVSIGATQFVLLSRGIMSYAHTAHPPDTPGFRWADVVEAIPLGYTILRRAQKIAVIRDGAVLRTWPKVVDRAEADDVRTRTWLDTACGYVVFDDRRYESEGFDREDHDGALARAVAVSAMGCGALLLYVYAAQDWH